LSDAAGDAPKLNEELKIKNEELAKGSEASCLGRMLAVPFFRSIYFNS
jgi:hypothetical protein